MKFELTTSAQEGLRDAAVRGTLIPFVGAGASRLAGCPGWAEFADRALKHFVDSEQLSHAQFDQLRDQPPRVKLSIARGLEVEYKNPIAFHELLRPNDVDSEKKGRQLFGNLSRLGKTFVTTNYDEWLDKEIVLPSAPLGEPSDPTSIIEDKKRQVFYREQDLTADNLDLRDTVIHLHGSVKDPHNMILTTRDYVRHYANDKRYGTSKENRVLTFLENLFKQKTVLFIGYGLEELEILEYVILNGPPAPDNAGEARHYLVQGFFSHQSELMQHLKRYYMRECGIELISYSRDRKDWDQLLDVVEELARVSPASPLMRLQEFRDMEGLLDV